MPFEGPYVLMLLVFYSPDIRNHTEFVAFIVFRGKQCLSFSNTKLRTQLEREGWTMDERVRTYSVVKDRTSSVSSSGRRANNYSSTSSLHPSTNLLTALGVFTTRLLGTRRPSSRDLRYVGRGVMCLVC